MSTAAILLLLKRFGPYIVVVLILGGIYAYGHHNGAKKWKERNEVIKTQYNLCVDQRDRNADEVTKLRDAIEQQNAAYALLEQRGYEREQRINAEHQAALQRQATAYQRAIEDARESTNDLRLRLDEMSVAEACHEAWLEVTE